jgi:hypothetical protein
LPRKIPPVPDEPNLSESNWNFDRVPDAELIACCYWEYARESARIRAAYDPDEVTFFPPFSAAPAHSGSPYAGRVLDRARGDFIFQLWEQALPVKITHDRAFQVLRPRAPLDHPWLDLPVELRNAVIQELAPFHPANPEPQFLAFNRCPDQRDLGLAGEDYQCACFDAESGVEYLRVQIDWAGFTDPQIMAAFKAWLVKNRPDGVGVASPRGLRKQKGYRDYLAWLGMLRLMNRCPFTSIQKEMPAAWRCYGKTDWPRARKKAGKVFHGIFPFLPPNELMIHWPTAGGRGR